MDDRDMDFTEEELEALEEIRRARELQDAQQGDASLPEMEEDGTDENVCLSDYATMTDEDVVARCRQGDTMAE